MYAQCLRGQKGGVTVLAINTSDEAAAVEVSAPAELYTLTAPELDGDKVLLNGRELAIGRDDHVPVLLPVRLKAMRATVGPGSITFVAIPRAANPNCT